MAKEVDDAQLKRFAVKQSYAEAVIKDLGDEWNGEALPNRDTLFTLVHGLFRVNGEEEWFNKAFSTQYWLFLVERYLHERKRGESGVLNAQGQ